jgi:Calx-beta domain
MLSINHLSRRARRAGTSTLLASFAAVSLLGGLVPSASAQSALSVSINDVAVTEGIDSSAVFKVSVSGKHPNQGITVDYETRDGSAVAGLDYTSTSGTLSIAAGDASGTITVPLIDDATHEPAETFKVKLLSSSVTIANNGDVGTATITSDDPQPQLRIVDATVTEGSGDMVFDVKLNRPSNSDVTVKYATVDGTAGGDDYVSKSGKLTFPADTNDTQEIRVPIKDDGVYEGDEELYVQLSDNFNAIIARDKATGTLVDDESKPVLAVEVTAFTTSEEDVSYTENVIVTLSGEADKDVTFSYSTFDGTKPAAHAGSDYTAVSNGTGTIRAGSTIGFVPVTVNGDTDVESDENFFVTISNPKNARLGSPTTQITLRNDD